MATTDSDHDLPIFPNLANVMTIGGPNQLWVADITYIAILAGFVYLAAILDAWSRRVVGYAISRSIDARLAMAALRAAIEAAAAAGLYPSFRSRIAVRCRDYRLRAGHGLVVRWAGEAIHTTMPKPRAS